MKKEKIKMTNKEKEKRYYLGKLRKIQQILLILLIGIMYLIILVMQIGHLKIKHLENQINTYDIYVHQERIQIKDAIKKYIDSLPMPSEYLTVENEEELFPKKQDVEGITPTITTLNTSAYCSCEMCCGKSDGITASGEKATAWYTVAAGRQYAIGTMIYIPALENAPNEGWFKVEDRGGAISDDKLDIFFSSHSEALAYGRKDLECYIYQF